MTLMPIRKPLETAIALAAAAATPSVSAQVDEQSLALKEMVVTARRRFECLQDVPIAVSAFSGDDLTMKGATDLTELAQLAPSVTLEPSRATNTTLTAFIRGVGQQDPLAGFEQGVALYLDDVYMARPQGALLDLYDVKRIEILRGPQGTLYGRNAVGGAIKYVTRRLSDSSDLRLKASAGSYNQLDLVATGSIAISDKFRIGGTVANFERDGFGESKTSGADQYDKDIFAYRLSAEFIPTEKLLFRLGYDNTDDQSSPVAGYRPFPGRVSGAPVLDSVYDTFADAAQQPSTAGINGKNQVESEGLTLTIDWNIGDRFTLRSITAQREDYTETVIDFDSLEVMDFDAPVKYDNEQFSVEFQLLYNSDNWNLVTGLYYLDAEASNDFDVVLGQLDLRVPGFGPGVTDYTRGVVATEAWSLYADATFNLSESWTLSLGGRYTEDKRTADIFRGSYLGIGSPFFGNDDAFFLGATSDYEASKTYDDFSPRINLNYAINDDASLYAGYSRGWKAGSFDPRGANFVTPRVEEGYDPEVLDSYELGLKSLWLDGRLLASVALFSSDYQDMQIPGSVGIDTDGDGINDDFVGIVTNAGKSEIIGLELEGSFQVTQNFQLQYAVSLLDPEIKEWIVNDENIADKRVIQNTPEEMVFIGATYLVSTNSGDINLAANWSYKSDIAQFETPNEVLDQEAYDMLNASVVWVSSNEHWLVGLHGKNLTDEEVKTSGYCFGLSAGCPSELGFEDNTTVFFASPRTFTLIGEYRY